MEVQLHSLSDGKTTGSVSMSDEVFNLDFNEALIHQVVTAYLADARRGTKAQKTRGEARGGGSKPWRQKGLGRARAGTIRSPIWRGGGRAFAARPRSYEQKINRKMYRGALRSILSELIRQDRLMVIETIDIDEPKTGKLVALLQAAQLDNVLIVADEVPENLYLAARNLHWVGLVDLDALDPALLLSFEKIVLTKTAVAKLEERLK
jgi:large subunit ribosomal protein L4